ncbi:MAG: hypothetical protein II998_10280 [Clostridia bacterium]|nr:hypothetical protein [Clostridia bacterium]
MKKFLALLLAGIMIFAFAACAGDDDTSSKTSKAKYEIDYESTEEQAMADATATVEKLKEVADSFEGTTMFFGDTRTYEDMVKAIGCDATQYRFNADQSTREYIWKAVDDETAQLLLSFADNGDKWVLSAAGSTNLDLEATK